MTGPVRTIFILSFAGGTICAATGLYTLLRGFSRLGYYGINFLSFYWFIAGGLNIFISVKAFSAALALYLQRQSWSMAINDYASTAIFCHVILLLFSWFVGYSAAISIISILPAGVILAIIYFSIDLKENSPNYGKITEIYTKIIDFIYTRYKNFRRN